MLGRMGACWLCRATLALLKMLEEQGWCKSLGHPGGPVVLERVNPVLCGLCSRQPCSWSWDIWQRLAGSSGPAHKGVNCAELSAPSPSPSSALHILCLGSRPHTSLICEVSLPGPLAPSAPSSAFLPASKEEKRGWGVTPSPGCSSEGCPWAAPPGLPLLTALLPASKPGAGGSGVRAGGCEGKTPALGMLLKWNMGPLKPRVWFAAASTALPQSFLSFACCLGTPWASHVPCAVALLPPHAPQTPLEELGSDMPTVKVRVH